MIQQITKKDFEESPGMRTGARTEFWEKIKSLEVDSGLKVFKIDWQLKSTPLNLISSRFSTSRRAEGHSGKKFMCKTLPNDEGWLILRFK